MITLNLINDFLEPRKMAVVGASRNTKKFGGAVFRKLKEKGFDVYPVNPNAGEIQEVKCHKTVNDLPGDVTHVLILTPANETEEVAKACVKKGVKMVWIQQKSDTPEAIRIIEDAGVPLIYKKCIMMFADPVKSFHKFHRSWVKFFGNYPKMVRSAN
jgi:predicted CoA-binding protein